MNIALPHFISQDIIIKCVISLTTSIVSSYNLYNIITTQTITNTDYQNYQNEISSTDVGNKLLVASSIIKDIIKRYHVFTKEEKDISVEQIIELYKIKLEPSISEDEEYNILYSMKNNNIISNVPEPVKVSLNSTLEIIDRINTILQKIHFKVKNYSDSYLKYFSRLNISNEVAILIKLDKTFDKRLNLFMNILKIYSHIIM